MDPFVKKPLANTFHRFIACFLGVFCYQSQVSVKAENATVFCKIMDSAIPSTNKP